MITLFLGNKQGWFMGIFLTGGGEQEYFQEIDRYFISQIPKPGKVLVIPFAADDLEYQDVKERLEDVFLGNYIKTVDLLETPRALTEQELDSYHAIYIEGGNTFKLIQAVRENDLFNSLLEFSKLNKPLYADSAGAILLGADTGTAFLGDDPDSDEEKLQSYRGLDIIPPWSVHAHYESSEDDALTQLVFDKANPVLALPEEGGVLIDEGSIFSMGQSPVCLFTFSGKEIIRPGEKFSLI